PATATIAVQGVNDAPTEITLSDEAVPKNEAIGTVIGTFAATDVDTNDTHTFELVAGLGDTDNPRFTIDGNQLKTAEAITVDHLMIIRVRATDSAGGEFETVFLLSPDQRPTVDLDADDSTVPGVFYATTFVEHTEADSGTGPVKIGDVDLALADADHSNLQSAVVTITNVADAGEESLAINGSLPAGISLDGSSTSTQLVLVGDAALGDYQLALGLIEYSHNSERPTEGNRLISVTVNDGQLDSFPATATVTVDERNDPPIPGSVELEVNEDDAVNAITSVLVTSANDPDSDSISVDQIDVTGLIGAAILNAGIVSYGPAASVESLSEGETTTTQFEYTLRDSRGGISQSPGTVQITITGQNDAPTDITLSAGGVDPSDPVGTAIGVLTQSDVDANDSWTWALVAGAGDDDNDRFTIASSGGNTELQIANSLPTQPSFSVRVRVSDNHGGVFEKALLLIGNHRPIINLDVDNSLGQSPSIELTFTEDDPMLVLHDGLSITDADGSLITTADIRLIEAISGDEALTLSDSLPPGLTLDAASTDSLLRINGSASLADYKSVFESVRYRNSDQDPSSDPRHIEFVVNDGTSLSKPVTATINVSSVNDPPMLSTSLSSSLTFTNHSDPVAIFPDLDVSDVDHFNLSGATITIGGYVSGEDLLEFTDQNGISGSFNVGSGELELSGVATVSEYQSALRSITFNNAADPLTAGLRTIDFVVTDGTDAS
ncbi:MAG: VCBS domain-containing protein, partial [Planctomycetales bacterium]|nr:VCBS domain-containing protein [Planctomycetales bacterium]